MIIKYLLSLILVVSCTATGPIKKNQPHTPKKLTVSQKLENCVEKMINDLAVNSSSAIEICERIYVRK